MSLASLLRKKVQECKFKISPSSTCAAVEDGLWVMAIHAILGILTMDIAFPIIPSNILNQLMTIPQYGYTIQLFPLANTEFSHSFCRLLHVLSVSVALGSKPSRPHLLG